jgi:hypothetical protein
MKIYFNRRTKALHATRYTLHDKGVALIIVIFAMMLFAVLGATLAVMQSGDFEVNLRNLDSERALNLAEAGAQEAVNMLVKGDPLFDADSDTLTRTLNFGQYYVTRSTSGSDITVTCSGYIPLIASYRAMRQVKLVVQVGGISKGMQVKELLDWSAAGTNPAHTVDIDADISAGSYNGDGNETYNQTPPAGQDYNPSVPLLPPGSGKRDFKVNFPTIDMPWYYNNANAGKWPSPSTRTIIAVAEVIAGGTQLQVTKVLPSDPYFFNASDINVAFVRRNSITDWQDTSNWRVITAVNNTGMQSRVTLSAPAVTWPDEYPFVGGTQVNIKIGKRFEQNAPNSGIYYIGTNIAGRPVDTLIDLRTNDLDFSDNNLICEGDIVIKGTNTLTMTFSAAGGSGSKRHPPLATKDGNIISTEAVSGANKRVICGLIYSENGLVNLNYLSHPTSGASWLRGNMVYGKQVTLDGDISIDFISAGVPPNGVTLTPTVTTWQEQ